VGTGEVLHEGFREERGKAISSEEDWGRNQYTKRQRGIVRGSVKLEKFGKEFSKDESQGKERGKKNLRQGWEKNWFLTQGRMIEPRLDARSFWGWKGERGGKLG